MAKQLSNGQTIEKVSSRWNLSSKLAVLHILVMTYRAISFQHVRRDVNKVEYMLANIGASENGVHRMGRLEDFEEEKWIPRC